MFGFGKNRRVIIVNKQLQWNFIMLTVTVAAVASILFSIDVYYNFYRDILLSENLAKLDLLKQDLSIKFIFLMIKLGGFCFLAFFGALLISHKFAGAIYRFEKTLQMIAKGDLSISVNLREGDQLVEFKNELNQTIASLRKIALGNKQNIEAVTHIFTEIEAKTKFLAIPENERNDLLTLINEGKRFLEKIKTSLKT
jgi:nitrogen fixation/metabolism regulation signal transduction histidine kinase